MEAREVPTTLFHAASEGDFSILDLFIRRPPVRFTLASHLTSSFLRTSLTGHLAAAGPHWMPGRRS